MNDSEINFSKDGGDKYERESRINPVKQAITTENLNTQSPVTKRARKSLLPSWSINLVQYGRKVQPFETETPSKFLTSGQSVTHFSPSNIMKDTLCSEQDMLFDEGKKENRPCGYRLSGGVSSDYLLDPKWARVACGKTKDQIFMEEQAYACLQNLALMPRSLNFESRNE